MSACEWSVYLNMAPAVTAHLIDQGIDTGPIFEVKEVELADNLERLCGACTVKGLELLLACVRDQETAPRQPTPQSVEDGRQYYLMHPFLEELTKKRLNARVQAGKPCAD